MQNMKRQGNQPGRRIAPDGFLDEATKEALLARVTYEGSANHKLRPGDYGFVPPQNPRPSKSPCDDIRSVLLDEAIELFRTGIQYGMVSKFSLDSVPKYVWAVDGDDEVYEAKTRPEHETKYHGYRLNDNDRFRRHVLDEWKQRCR